MDLSPIIDGSRVFLGAAAVLMMSIWSAILDSASNPEAQHPTAKLAKPQVHPQEQAWLKAA